MVDYNQNVVVKKFSFKFHIFTVFELDRQKGQWILEIINFHLNKVGNCRKNLLENRNHD